MTVIQNTDLLDRITKTAANAIGNPEANLLYGAPTLVIISGKPNDKLPIMRGCIPFILPTILWELSCLRWIQKQVEVLGFLQ